MALTLKLDDVKPLLGAVGLGEDPTPAPKPVNTIPPPPMQMPPTPAAAGFTEWASDPQNAKKVTDGITPPGAPLLPPPAPLGANVPLPNGAGQMASVNPPVIPRPSIAPPTDPNAGISSKLGADQAELARLQSTGSGVSQIKSPFLRTLARVGDVAGTVLAPGVAAAIPGTTVHNWTLQNQQQGRIAGDQANLKDAAALADTQSQTAQRNAAADKANQQAADLVPVPLTKEQAAAINQPTLEGTGMTPRDYNRLVGLAGNNNTSQANNAATNATRVTTNAKTNDTKAANNAANNDRAKAVADAANKTKLLMQNMRDNTSRANNENTVANKGTTGAGGFKVPADVTKRAALASNVNENVDAAEKIIQRNPGIFGAAGGRYTNVQQMIGSNDPDIQEMGVRMHNIALASNGAHGVRAQQAIQKTEDELFNNFKTGPQGMAGSFKATRSSMQTFLNDEQNFSNSGKRTGGITPPPTGGDTIKVQIPGQPAGTIHASQLEAFKAKYPNATVLK